jgi:hypothetical protein
MKTDWEIFEKIVSTFQVLFGIAILFTLIWSVNFSYNQTFERLDLGWKDISIFKLITKYHFTAILGLVGIIGGIGWFRYKTYGWLLSFMFWFLLGLSSVLVLLKYKQQEPNVVRAFEEYLIYYSTIFTSFFLATLIMFKNFWNKYNPRKISLIIFGTILLTLVLDKIIQTG